MEKKRFRYELIPLYCLYGTIFLMILGFLTSKNFKGIISLPDNIPIAMMLIIVEYFTYLGLRQAAANDEFTRTGQRQKIYEEMIK